MVRCGEKNNMLWQSDSCLPYQNNHKNDWISVPASPTILGPKQSKLSELIWTFTQALLFVVEIGFVSLSLSLYTWTYTWEKTYNSTTRLKLLLLDIFNFKKNLSRIRHVITKPKATKLSPNVIRAFP